MTRNRGGVRVYIREAVPEKYVERMRQLGASLTVDPWNYTGPEPEPTVDLSEYQVLMTTGAFDPLHIANRMPKLDWVHSFSVGLDAFAGRSADLRNVLITNSRGCTAVPVAEHAVAMIMALAKNVPVAMRNQLASQWRDYPVIELQGAVVGIIGYGRIGREIAQRCKALRMQVLGCRKHPDGSRSEEADLLVGLDRVDEVIERSDFVVLSLPLNIETVGFMDAARLRRMKPGSYLINVGRGGLVIEPDLLKALHDGPMAGAALDVFEREPLDEQHPLWSYDNVILTPHKAYDSPRNDERRMALVLENLQRYLNRMPMINVVDLQDGY